MALSAGAVVAIFELQEPEERLTARPAQRESGPPVPDKARLLLKQLPQSCLFVMRREDPCAFILQYCSVLTPQIAWLKFDSHARDVDHVLA